MPDVDLESLVGETDIYGYPLVYCMEEIGKLPTGEATMFAGKAVPFNRFGHMHALATPTTKFVSPNNDTLYSIAPLDLSHGPVELRVPDTAGRYYVLQFIDAWTNNFAYIGRRATGTGEGRYLLTPPSPTT